ncbi:hypothetical protein SISNIDRAFT_458695 [Sistotremastrum niveocremeum HHB9708]|uniref:Arrestin-like N-terminal domain-containing protein n=1 Tax=Sistotremastrum niveocremeum HHB9708 TaxID=1314777 RepID=A0A164QB10_9AGAM|nr:hypothetical protein SISNIDRAFT_458695 [Sistotremastrum niveocremeum HHB9708]
MAALVEISPSLMPPLQPRTGYLPKEIEHVSTTEMKGGDRLTLKVTSFASSAISKPVFVEGRLIEGSVAIQISKPQSVNQISIKLVGSGVLNVRNSTTFLVEEKVLWDKGHSSLNAQQEIPFVMDIPRTYTLPESDDPSAQFPHPPTFLGKRYTISYVLTVLVQRKAFSRDIVLECPCVYVPLPHAAPSTYKTIGDDPFVLGPSVDASEWVKGSPAIGSGRLLNGEEVELTTTMYLANPLIYSRSSYIPIRLVLHSTDPRIKGLLSDHIVPRLSLVKREMFGVRRRMEPITTDVEAIAPSRFVSAAKSWCPSKESADSLVFHAEIPLNSSMTPTFGFETFALRYYVVLLPWICDEIKFQEDPDIALLQQEVEIIATPLNPSPASYAPNNAKTHDASRDHWGVSRSGKMGAVMALSTQVRNPSTTTRSMVS